MQTLTNVDCMNSSEYPSTPTQLLDLVDEWSEVFKVMSDPTRFRLLLVLHYQGPGQMTMTQLAQECDLRPATASAALRYMSNLGMVSVKRDGRRMMYSIADQQVHELLHYIGDGAVMHRASTKD